MTEHCETVVTPEGLVRECVNPELRRITQDVCRVSDRWDRIEADRRIVEADGFTLAWQRLL